MFNTNEETHVVFLCLQFNRASRVVGWTCEMKGFPGRVPEISRSQDKTKMFSKVTATLTFDLEHQYPINSSVNPNEYL